MTSTPLPEWVRIVREPGQYPVEAGHVRAPSDAVRFFRERLGSEEVEVFAVLMLDTQGRVLALQEVTRGILNSSLVHPREVFRMAIAYGAASIIVAHNHPSGEPTPSAEDKAVTRQMVESGNLLDIPVYDHIIVAGEQFHSFAEAGTL